MDSNDKKSDSRGFFKKALNEKGIITKTIVKIGNLIESFAEKVEGNYEKGGKKNYIPEITVFFLYVIGQICMMFFHEPGAEEALPWLIARDSTIYEVIFVVPHYEFCPSLWYLVLMPFAKLGTSYELTLNLINLAFTGAAICFILFKAPFKRIIRLLLPFSFFLFYQYGVVNSSFSMMILGFVLLSVIYGKKDLHPVRFGLALIYLSTCGTFSAIIVAGLCIVWIIDKCNVKKLGLGVLVLAYIGFLAYRLLPEEDSLVSLLSKFPGHDLLTRIGYSTFGVLSDLFVTNTFFETGSLIHTTIDRREFIAALLIGFIILCIVIRFAYKKKKLFWFIIPWILFSASATFLNFTRDQIGVLSLFLMLFVWICCQESYEKFEKKSLIIVENTEKTKPNLSAKKNESTFRSLLLIALALVVAINLYWSISSCILDISGNYSSGRVAYECVETYGLLNENILTRWEDVPKLDEGPEAITVSNMGVCLAPYISNNNQIMNTVYDLGKNYSLFHQIPSGNATEDLQRTIEEKGAPVAMLGMPYIMSIYKPTDVNFRDYEVVMEYNAGSIWKGVPEEYTEKIYILKSFLE